MLKLALIILGILILAGGTFFAVYRFTNTPIPLVDAPREVPKNLPAVPDLTPESPNPSATSSANPKPSSTPIKNLSAADSASKISTLENKIQTLENSISNLQSRLTQLEGTKTTTSTSTQTSSSSSKATQYIYALGYGGSSTATDWTEISTLNVTVDPSLYVGYTSMQLEAFIRVKDGNGQAFARLYSAGSSVGSSELSTTSYQNTWVSSGNFTLSSKKTYTFQVKSLTGYETFLENARLKINF